jgi:hypothetical protein
MGKQLSAKGLYGIYKYYKEEFLPKLIEEPTVSSEDKKNKESFGQAF